MSRLVLPRIEVREIPGIHIDFPAGGWLQDAVGLAFRRYGKGLTYLIRPDEHVAAVFAQSSKEEIVCARDRSLGRLGIGGNA